ncbi:hypothetical protein P4O66_020586 [Electrophorus voltai]|uniref:Uncharacterized protein n=1 Tax=Electrophorus voltai TaxID=2609070 RepID=A0AAD8ZSV5_9TELE|nr:hypothetical protein P4O66_020586 [Electrophorus voltai]
MNPKKENIATCWRSADTSLFGTTRECVKHRPRCRYHWECPSQKCERYRCHDEGSPEAADGQAAVSASPGASHVSSPLSLPDEEGEALLQSYSVPAGAAASSREQAVYSSVLTLRAGSGTLPRDLVQSLPSPPGNSDDRTNHKTPEKPPAGGSQTPTHLAQIKSASSTSPEDALGDVMTPDLPTAPGSFLRILEETEPAHTDHMTRSDPASTLGSNSSMAENASSISPARTNPDTVTGDSLQLTTVTTTTVTPLTVTATTVTPPTTGPVSTAAVTTTAPPTTSAETTTLATEPPTTTVTTTTTTTTTTMAAPTTTTLATTTTTATPQSSTVATSGSSPTRPNPPTESTPTTCNVTEKFWVRTVVAIQMKRNRLEDGLKQSLARGLSLAVQRAFNDSSVRVELEREASTPSNVTLGYYVMNDKTVFMAAVVVESLTAYGLDKLLKDIRHHTPAALAVPVPVATWLPPPGIHLQLKTVLRFVSPTDDIKSCSFVQTMEQRLENVFSEAQEKVDDTYGILTVEILNTYQTGNSLAVSLVYVVWNGSSALNGTVATGLVNQLTAELVGYFLFFPPMLIAEPLEYHNLNTSVATREFWVITVIQDVDSSSLEGSYQSFASLMEQRLAELFLVAGRRGLRFRRATTIGGYTVQMVSIRRLPGPKNPAEMTYYVQVDGAPIPGTSAAKTLNMVDSQTMALTLGYFVQVQAELAVVKSVPSNLWILAVLTPVSLAMVAVVMVIAIVCRRNRTVFKTSAFRGFHPRTKTSYRRDGSYHHQPVQGFDYVKQHMGQPGEEALTVTKETLVLSLPVRDAPLLQDKGVLQDGTASKRSQPTEVHRRTLCCVSIQQECVLCVHPAGVCAACPSSGSVCCVSVQRECALRVRPAGVCAACPSSGSVRCVSVQRECALRSVQRECALRVRPAGSVRCASVQRECALRVRPAGVCAARPSSGSVRCVSVQRECALRSVQRECALRRPVHVLCHGVCAARPSSGSVRCASVLCFVLLFLHPGGKEHSGKGDYLEKQTHLRAEFDLVTVQGDLIWWSCRRPDTRRQPCESERVTCKLPSDNGSVSSSGSGKLNTGRSSTAHRGMSQKNSKDETHTRTEHYDSLTGSLRLLAIKPMATPLNYSYPDSSNHSQESVILNGEVGLPSGLLKLVNMGLKQKSDIEHYRNKLRLKAKRKGYNDSPTGGGRGHRHDQRERLRRGNASLDLEALGPAEDRKPSTYIKYRRSESQREPPYWSRQSLNTPSPVEPDLDLLFMGKRSRRGIRNSGYDLAALNVLAEAEPEPFEETDVDHLMSSLGFGGSHQVKGHSDSSTLSSQPSIDEVRQQMHLLLDNAFGLASAEPPAAGRLHHNHHPHPHSPYNPSQSSPYSDGVTSAPGTMDHPAGALQRGSSFEPDVHQCSLPKPGFRFTQLPDMGLGSPPPLIPPRAVAPPGTSIRRSTPDMSLKPCVSEASEMSQHNGAPYLPINRAPFPAVTVDQSMSSYSGNPMTAVYAISANRPGYSDYFVLSPSSSYRSPSWMSYPPEPDDLPRQWSDTVNLTPDP